MKNSFIYAIMLFLGMTVATSCSNEEQFQQMVDDGNTIQAIIENVAETRTSVNDIYQVVWTADDKFDVWDGATFKGVLKLKSGAGTTSASFKDNDENNPVDAVSGMTAFFPSNNQQKKAFVFAEQYDSQETDAPMLGSFDGSKFTFTLLTAMVRVVVADVPAGDISMTMTSVDNLKLTGMSVLDENGELGEPQNGNPSVSVSFTTNEKRTLTFDVPVPVQNYTSGLKVVVRSGENKVLDRTTNPFNAIAGKLYRFDAAYVTVNSASDASIELAKDGVTAVKVENLGENPEISIPAKPEASAEVVHTIDLSGVTLPTATNPLTINVEESSDGDGKATVENLTIVVPDGTVATGKLNINAPGTTVTIQAANGTVIEVIEAITAENTLIIGEGVTVNTLKILGGNVKFNGTVNKILDANDNEYTLVKTVDELTAAITNNKTHIILGADIQSSEIITINKSLTLNGSGYTLTSTATRAINVETTGTVAINNLNIVAGERAVNIINQASTVNLNSVTATAKNNAVMIATSAGAVKLAVKDCDFTGLAVINVAGAGSQVTVTDTKITNVDATEAENYGAITVWSSAAGASVSVTGGEIIVTDDSKQAYVFPADATITGVDDIGYIVALDGDAGYDTLKEAVEKAAAGATIELVRNVEASEIITIDKSLTLNGNGMTLTSTAARAINIETTGTVTITDLNIVAGERAINIINQASTVNLNSVTATAKNNAVMIATSAGAVKLAVKDCDFTGLAVINVAGAGSQVTVTDTKITNVDATEAENYGAITVWSSAAGASVSVTGGEIIVADDSKQAYVFPSYATVTGVDNIGYIVALDGDAGYETLEEAVEKAEAGATIELVRNVNLSSPIEVTKNLTLKLNGCNITASGKAFSISNAVLTIEGEGDVVYDENDEEAGLIVDKRNNL